jgi:cytochrome d ubiquinol oxidase subunit II
MYERLGLNPGIVPITAGGAMLAAGYFIQQKRSGWGFILTGISIIFSTISLFMGLYPRLIVSSLNPEWSLTIENAASSEYTLRVMSIVALIFIPIVLAYQGWSYYIFRRRLTSESKLEY